MNNEEVKLRIIEAMMKLVPAISVVDVIKIAKSLEEYVLDSSDKVGSPDDGEKERRPRRALKAKE